jgi:DNA-binding transcriptional regulator YdaS (Cro superfamily)
MAEVNELNILIDKASAIAGSDYKLAKLIGAAPQNVSNWRHGSASCSPENRALIAAVAGLDPVAELARAVVEKHAGTSKGDMLMKALGKGLLVTGVALASAGAAAHQISSMVPGATDLLARVANTMCVMSN